MADLEQDPVSYANQVSFDKKINTPFAESGDKTEIPEESNYDLVNQKEGFTELYETPIGEGGEYVERQTINQVLYDTQSAVKEIQELGEGNGFPADLENSNGILPVVNGGTGNSSGKAPSAATADYATSAGSADSATTATNATLADEAVKLQTARTIRTNLATTSTASFDGTANITPGVTGTLPVGNGGTGITSNPSMLVNLASNSSASVFTSSPRPGVTGVLPIENGGTGSTNVYNNLYNNGLQYLDNVDICSSILSVPNQYEVIKEDAWLFPRASARNSGSYFCYCDLNLALYSDYFDSINIYNRTYDWTMTLGGFSYADDPVSTILNNINSTFNKNFTNIEGITNTAPFLPILSMSVIENGVTNIIAGSVNSYLYEFDSSYHRFTILLSGVYFDSVSFNPIYVRIPLKFNVY